MSQRNLTRDDVSLNDPFLSRQKVGVLDQAFRELEREGSDSLDRRYLKLLGTESFGTTTPGESLDDWVPVSDLRFSNPDFVVFIAGARAICYTDSDIIMCCYRYFSSQRSALFGFRSFLTNEDPWFRVISSRVDPQEQIKIVDAEEHASRLPTSVGWNINMNSMRSERIIIRRNNLPNAENLSDKEMDFYRNIWNSISNETLMTKDEWDEIQRVERERQQRIRRQERERIERQRRQEERIRQEQERQRQREEAARQAISPMDEAAMREAAEAYTAAAADVLRPRQTTDARAEDIIREMQQITGTQDQWTQITADNFEIHADTATFPVAENPPPEEVQQEMAEAEGEANAAGG